MDKIHLTDALVFYGYKKFAYYQLKEAFNEVTAFNENPDVLFDLGYKIRPIAVGCKDGKEYSLTVEIYGEEGTLAAKKSFRNPQKRDGKLFFGEWNTELSSGYYTVRYTVKEE